MMAADEYQQAYLYNSSKLIAYSSYKSELLSFSQFEEVRLRITNFESVLVEKKASQSRKCV